MNLMTIVESSRQQTNVESKAKYFDFQMFYLNSQNLILLFLWHACKQFLRHAFDCIYYGSKVKESVFLMFHLSNCDYGLIYSQICLLQTKHLDKYLQFLDSSVFKPIRVKCQESWNISKSQLNTILANTLSCFL